MSGPGPGAPADEPAHPPQPAAAPPPEDRSGPSATGAGGPAGAPDRGAGGPVVGDRAVGDRAEEVTDPAAGDGEPVDPEVWAAAARRRERAIRGTLAAALCLEALTVLFVPRAVARVGDDGLTTTRLTILVVIAALLLVAAGLVKRRAGLVLGSALQVAVIATGVMVGAMYFLGLLFAGVWAYVLWVRQEIIDASRRAGAPG